MEAKVKFAETLTSGLETMLASGNHADVTIVVDGKVFPCHKVVLCAMSPYFEAMFNHDMIETRGGIVTLYDIQPDVFGKILKFIYTGEDIVNQTNAEAVFRASSMLQIPCLQERCENFLLHQVSRDNCVGIWKLSKAQNCQNLAEIAFLTILENFTEVSAQDDFQNLEADEIVTLVENDLLSVPDEETVCNAIMSWVKFDPSRQRDLADILAVLRLPLVSPDFLFQFADDEIFKDGDGHGYITDAFKYQLCPSRRPQFTSARCLQRRNTVKNDCLVIVGGLLKTMPRFQTTKEVVCYSFQQEQWFYLPSMPYDPGYEFAVCEDGSNLYVSGGWLKLQGMAVYRAEKNKWKTCDVMTHGRCGHCMVALTDVIYVLGGRDGTAPAMTNIEKFDKKTKKWSLAGELLLGIRSTSASVVGENIFLFGGITENDKDTDKVQCYDTRTATSTIIGELPFACRLTRTVSCDDTVYIVLPDGRVMTFDKTSSRKRIESLSELSFSFDADDAESSFLDAPTSTSSRESAVLPSPTSPKSRTPVTSEKENSLGNVMGRIIGFNQHHFEVIQHRGNLLLAGGKTPDNLILRTILIVDPDSCKILSQIEMPASRWCFGCSKVVIRKEYLNNAIRGRINSCFRHI